MPICDGQNVVVVGIMEHIEEAGVHSGDSACAIPLLQPAHTSCSKRSAQPPRSLALHLNVIGLMNIQFAVKKEDGKPNVYVLEVNPASQPHGAVRGQGDRRARGQTGGESHGRRKACTELGLDREPIPAHVSIKESVFPFRKFVGVDIVLGPEMRSTGRSDGNQ